MKYYRIVAHSPYCGECNYYYFATESEEELMKYACECVEDNAHEWYAGEGADENYPEWDDYIDDCYCVIDEIDEDVYKEETNL